MGPYSILILEERRDFLALRSTTTICLMFEEGKDKDCNIDLSFSVIRSFLLRTLASELGNPENI
jgi:hypothetical protein